MHVAARSKTFHEQEGEANLFEYFEWSVQEKLDIEQKPGRKVFEPHEANVWLLLAEKFPATGKYADPKLFVAGDFIVTQYNYF